MTRIVPPSTRRWYEVLPKPYHTERPVVLVLLPSDWEILEGETPDEKYKVTVARSPDQQRLRGLQLIHADIPTYMDQREAFSQYGIRMADPPYIGAISTLPQKLLLDENRTPIMFCRDQMWRRPVNLRRVFKAAEMKC